MKSVTLKEAKARLNELVEAAVGGEQVVLMRGSKHVAAIVPISADDLELTPRLTDDQAARFWQSLAAESSAGVVHEFSGGADAVAHLKAALPKKSRRSSGRH